jgi:hypothetical protein
VQAISRVVSARRSAYVFCVLDVLSHKQTLQGAHEKGKIEEVRDVPSNALHSREICSRQAGATKKRATVKRNGVQVNMKRV